jgi:hypothetical protein
VGDAVAGIAVDEDVDSQVFDVVLGHIVNLSSMKNSHNKKRGDAEAPPLEFT